MNIKDRGNVKNLLGIIRNCKKQKIHEYNENANLESFISVTTKKAGDQTVEGIHYINTYKHKTNKQTNNPTNLGKTKLSVIFYRNGKSALNVIG